MARDQPVTDAEIENAREAIREQKADVRAYLESEGVDTSSWNDETGDTVPDADREPADSD